MGGNAGNITPALDILVNGKIRLKKHFFNKVFPFCNFWIFDPFSTTSTRIKLKKIIE